MPEPLGIHVLYELYDCHATRLDDRGRMREVLYDAVRSVKMVPLEDASHQYQPQGVSVVILVAESHIAIHTWPEYGYAAVDFFSCRTDIDPQRVCSVLKHALNPGRVEMQVIQRGSRAGGKPCGQA